MKIGIQTKYSLTILSLIVSIVFIMAVTLLIQFRTSIYNIKETSSKALANDLFEQLKRRGELLTSFLAEDLANPVYLYDMETIYDITKLAREQKDVIYVYVYDPKGKVIHDGIKKTMLIDKILNDEVSKKALSSKSLLIQTNKDLIDVAVPIKVHNELMGGVRVGLSTKGIDDDIKNMISQLDDVKQEGMYKNLIVIILTTIGLSLFGMILAIFVSRNLTRPIKTLSKLTSRIGRGEYDIEIPIKRSDEIGELVDSLKKMIQDIQQTTVSRDKYEKAYKDLERSTDEIRKLNVDLTNARDQAFKATRAKSSFLANMSHELRTPMNAIIGYTEMLIDDAEDAGQEDSIPDLRKIREASKHLLALINDILDLSKIEAGKMGIYLETFDISTMIKDVVATIQPLVEKNANTLNVNCANDIGVMNADLAKVRQGLFNLLSNASKFCKEGAISLDVVRETVNGIDWVSFDVVDTGIGLTPEQMNKIFQVFNQADDSTTRDYGGTGLGLSITRHFCQMLGGDVKVKSEAGVGTTFTIRLPAKGVQQDVEPAAVGVEELEDDTLSKGEDVVLVIDDDPSTRDLLKRSLNKDGFYVITASSGGEGLRLARELRPSVITLDVLMPGMDGWAVLAALKAEPELADIPAIMITIVDDKGTGFALGATEYMTKPIDRDRLLSILEKYRIDQQRQTILIVEDDINLRELMRRNLEKEGKVVIEAENGHAALERMAETCPDLIFLDLIMPEMDGFEFIAELHKNKKEWQTIPIVVVTAKDLTDEDHMRLNGYVEKVLQKGNYNCNELLGRIHDLVTKLIKVGWVKRSAPNKQ